MSQSTYIVGIDLGTSNCAVAFSDGAQLTEAKIVDFPVPQLIRPGEVSAQPLLPSFLYLAGEHELPAESIALPWDTAQERLVVGEMARWQGTRVPARLVASAKSWLCHPGVDRMAPILPWGASAEVTKLSPVDASAKLLAHIARSWDANHAGAPLAEQEIVITVPASFDEVARALTVNAARLAGLEKFTLLEEPQAAFYDFTAVHRKDLSRALENIHLVLVVDVGGGTSDFTLVQVGISPEGPVLRRIAVGDHLMLGGDNMDAALARRAEVKMTAGGRKLSSTQWSQLVQTARTAKETLLGHAAPEQYHLSLVMESSRLIGSSLSANLTQDEVAETVLEGFFPRSGRNDLPSGSGASAIQELGLPYAHDPAVTRHLAAFLQRHAAAGFSALGATDDSNRTAGLALPRPDAILLNGGVFNSKRIARRLLEAVSAWWPEAPPIKLLDHGSLELAVARGAAQYGLVRRGLGRRISGGAARAYYIGLGGPKEPGEESVLCVVTRGQEEGETVDLGDQVFHLALGTPVQFPLFSTTSDRVDKPGSVIARAPDLQPLPPIHTLLKGTAGRSGLVPVHLRAGLTEIGTLELWCVSNESDERWRLEFEVRGTATVAEPTVIESMPARFGEARDWITHMYGHKPPKQPVGMTGPSGTPGAPGDVKHLWGSLEKSLGPREQWRLPVLRELWGVLQAGAGKRRRSAQHERIFLQLLGYTLRPGFGYPLDGWRCAQAFALWPESVTFHKEIPVWVEFWILWRRVAGGLNEPQQQELWHYLKSQLLSRLVPAAKHLARPKGIQPEGLDEMVRTAASLEHIAAEDKTELGRLFLKRLCDPARSAGPWAWAVGRLGARTPIYGSSHQTIPPGEAARWLEQLLNLDLKSIEGLSFAVAQIARLTGDRARDVDESVRRVALEALRNAGAPPGWVRMVSEVVTLETADQARAFGDTLPAGLRLA